MASAGDKLIALIPFKFFVAGTFYEAQLVIDYVFWEDGSYTIFNTVIKFPGFAQLGVLPFQIKDKVLHDANFIKAMNDEIVKVRTDKEPT